MASICRRPRAAARSAQANIRDHRLRLVLRLQALRVLHHLHRLLPAAGTKITSQIRRVLLAACVVFAANFTVVVILGSYDFHLGPLHLASHECFKPLLYMNAAFLLACLANARSSEPRPAASDSTNPWLVC